MTENKLQIGKKKNSVADYLFVCLFIKAIVGEVICKHLSQRTGKLLKCVDNIYLHTVLMIHTAVMIR